MDRKTSGIKKNFQGITFDIGKTAKGIGNDSKFIPGAFSSLRCLSHLFLGEDQAASKNRPPITPLTRKKEG